MEDPGWGIWGKFPPPCGGAAMLLIKIATKLCQAKISLSTHENMHILLQIYLKPKRMKVKLTVKL